MTIADTDRATFNSAAQVVLRVLIASYFLAVSLELIPGTDLGILFATVLSAPWNGALAAASVFILAFMIMIALHTRVAALLLALMTFYASYLAMIELGVQAELGGFWRDLALISALLLTYGEANPEGRRPRRLVRRQIVPRRARDILAEFHARSAPAVAKDMETQSSDLRVMFDRAPRPRPAPETTRPEREQEEEIENIFADMALAS